MSWTVDGSGGITFNWPSSGTGNAYSFSISNITDQITSSSTDVSGAALATTVLQLGIYFARLHREAKVYNIILRREAEDLLLCKLSFELSRDDGF
jgi:hypothetical protein